MEHYRCFKCYIPSLNTIRDSPTIEWFPMTIKFPMVTADTYLKQTAEDMLSLLHHSGANPHAPIPGLTYGSQITNAYIQIAQILCRATTHPQPRPAITPTPASEQRVESTPWLPPHTEPRVVTPQESHIHNEPERPTPPTTKAPTANPIRLPPTKTLTTSRDTIQHLLTTRLKTTSTPRAPHKRVLPTPFGPPLSVQQNRHRYFTRQSQQLAQTVTSSFELYAHHIANL